MRRLARHLFTLCSAVSLLLCIAVCVLWVRSYATEVILVDSHAGRLLLIGLEAPAGPARAAREAYTAERFLNLLVRPPAVIGTPATAAEYRWLGFWFARGSKGLIRYPNPAGERRTSLTCAFWIVGVPYWSMALLSAAVPATWLWRSRVSRRRLAAGRCGACGYDLRATPDRCPECGAATPAVS